MINGKQCTIAWYVNDNKIDKGVVTHVIDILKSHFRDHLVVSRGKRHRLLGMDIEMNDDFFSVGMVDQIEEAITMFSESCDKTYTSPDGKHLFDIHDTDSLLDETRSDISHSVVSKLLFIMKRACPDIETAVSFLMTRMSCSTTHDWLKLQNILSYLRCSIDKICHFGDTSLTTLFTWIDAAYGVHSNFHSHTGGCMSFGLGTVHCKASKQCINVKSSTKAELVAVSDYIPYTIWICHFLEVQG